MHMSTFCNLHCVVVVVVGCGIEYLYTAHNLIILYIMELSVSRNLACALFSWSRSIFLESSIFFKAFSAMHTHFSQHFDLLKFVVTRERKWQISVQVKTERVVNVSWWSFYHHAHPNIRCILQ